MPQHSIIAFSTAFGESGRGNDKLCFRMPRFLCCLPNGNLAIGDSMNQRLLVVTPDGDLVKSIGEPGLGPGMLRGPSGLVCDGSNLFVCEAGNHRIQKLKLATSSPSKGGPAPPAEPGATGGDVTVPASPPSAAGAEGAAATAGEPPSASVDGVSKADGAPLGRAGSHGSKKPNELWCPQGIAISKRFSSEVKELFVADSINGRVVVFDASSMDHVRTFGERGSERGKLHFPSGIAVPPEAPGELPVFVSELGSHRISVFSKKGQFERCFGEKGTLPGQLLEPRSIAFAKGWLLIAESKRVSVFAPSGEAKQVLDIPGAGLLWGVCSSLEGKTAYVTDVRAGNAKVVCLDVVGAAYDDGATPAELAARLAAAKKRVEEEKMAEWQAQRAAGKKGD